MNHAVMKINFFKNFFFLKMVYFDIPCSADRGFGHAIKLVIGG